MKVVGLTGGIGSGKSEVARVWADLGATVLEADRFGHDVLENDIAVRGSLARRFGKSVVDARGRIARAEVARLAFASPANLRALNRIVGGPLVKNLHREVERLRSRKRGVLVVDAALLCEWNSPISLDLRILVTAPRNLKLKWLAARGLSLREAARRMSYQWPDRKKRPWADVEIRNDGSLARLRQKAYSVWRTELDCR